MRLAALSAVLATLLAMVFAAPALAGHRVALVIGNSRYETVPALANPANDAAAVASSLKAAGFDDVKLAEDLRQGELLRTLRDFAATVVGADVAVVYFAGHGVEADGRNYLVPIDAALAQARDVEFEAVSLDAVRSSVAGAAKLRVIILDACRNNPFRLVRPDGKRSIGRGLARVEPGSNELVAYAAREGTMANDAAAGGSHSPYTAALVKHLAEPGIDVRLLFGRVRDEVLSETGGTQEPFTYGTLGGDALPLNASVPEMSAGPASPPDRKPPTTPGLSTEAAQLWPLVEGTKSCAVLQSFIDRVGDARSPFVGFAQARRTELGCDGIKATSAAVDTAPATPTVVVPPAPATSTLTASPAIRTLTPAIVPVGKWAEGVAYDGRSLWVAESGQRSIVQLDKNGAIVRRVAVGRLPVGMATRADGHVYALVQTDRAVWQEIPGRPKGGRLASLKECPQAMAATDEAVWVLTLPDCSSANSRVIRIDPATGQLQETGPLGEWGQAIAASHGKVWVAHARGPALSVIDPGSMRAESRAIDKASLWAITSNRTSIFVGGRIDEDNGRGVIVAIDPASSQERFRLAVDHRIAVLAADDETLVAVGENGTVWTLSAKDLTLRSVITLSIGSFQPSSALIRDDRLIIVAQQYKGENGAVLSLSDWR